MMYVLCGTMLLIFGVLSFFGGKLMGGDNKISVYYALAMMGAVLILWLPSFILSELEEDGDTGSNTKLVNEIKEVLETDRVVIQEDGKSQNEFQVLTEEKVYTVKTKDSELESITTGSDVVYLKKD